ncbi:MAG: hypothetical protein LH702_05925, partial [Phormidesmis sp. CAN_BIN44]|nr:hypothetical protein [Phormidesmis sp. CAN_BIN44]
LRKDWQADQAALQRSQLELAESVKLTQHQKETLASFQQSIKQQQESLSDTYRELSQAHQELQSLKQVREECKNLQVKLESAYQRISEVETSKFWRLRSLWLRCKQKLGLPTS